jgi:hypothetical protein
MGASSAHRKLRARPGEDLMKTPLPEPLLPAIRPPKTPPAAAVFAQSARDAADALKRDAGCMSPGKIFSFLVA